MRPKTLALITIFLAVVFCSEAHAYWIWTPKTGKWINPKYAPKDTPQEQFEVAMRNYTEKKYDAAIRDFSNLVKFFPRAKEAAEAQFYVGVCYEKNGYYYQAFQAYQKTIDEYPYTSRFKEIIARQYRLGELFLGGAKVKYWKIPLYPSYEKAAEIFKKVVDNDPYSKYADSALYNLGESYKKVGNYQEAMLAYMKIISDYPSTKLMENAKFQVAYCSLKGSAAPGYDDETTDKAIKEFQEFIEKKPDSEFADEAREALVLLEDVKAKSLYDVGQFYDKQNDLSPAAVYYQEILDLYPESSWAMPALLRMRYIKAALGEEWQEPDITSISKTGLSKKALEAKMEQLKPKELQLEKPQIPEPTSDMLGAKPTTSAQQAPVLSQPTVSRKAIILNQVSCQNSGEIAKIWLWTDKSIAFSHSYSEIPPKIYFKPIELVATTTSQMVKVGPGVVSSITIVKSAEKAPEDLPGYYGVAGIIIETKIPVKYRVEPQDSKILITIEKK